jgi:hypothetical protein
VGAAAGFQRCACPGSALQAEASKTHLAIESWETVAQGLLERRPIQWPNDRARFAQTRADGLDELDALNWENALPQDPTGMQCQRHPCFKGVHK